MPYRLIHASYLLSASLGVPSSSLTIAAKKITRNSLAPPFTNITGRTQLFQNELPWNDQKSGNIITRKIPGVLISVELPAIVVILDWCCDVTQGLPGNCLKGIDFDLITRLSGNQLLDKLFKEVIWQYLWQGIIQKKLKSNKLRNYYKTLHSAAKRVAHQSDAQE